MRQVSILTHPKRWVLRALVNQGRRRQLVSILTHPKRWVLHHHRQRSGWRYKGFNPHPPEKVGATVDLSRTDERNLQFQSSPTRKGGCYLEVSRLCTDGTRFQSSPTRKGGCYDGVIAGNRNPAIVSILTHPKRWVLRKCPMSDSTIVKGFNPHPPEKVGATGPGRRQPPIPQSFNPHPPEKVGATASTVAPYARLVEVSILTHPKRWVLPLMSVPSCCSFQMFQSSPTRKGGCYTRQYVNTLLPHAVSILTHPKRWVLPAAGTLSRQGLRVSILTHPKRWVLRGLR